MVLSRGEVSEWFKEPVLKTGDSARGRGFESHPLRHFDATIEYLFYLTRRSTQEVEEAPLLRE